MLRTQNKNIAGKSLALILGLVLAASFFALTADGHAKLLRSAPANGEKLAQPPTVIELTFSEQLQSTEINSIVVTDRSGRRIDKKTVALAEDGKKMIAEL